MAHRYDPDMEDEVLAWIKDLTGEDIPGGQREVERALRSGVVLVNLAATVQQGSPHCPARAAEMKLVPNMQKVAFKQILCIAPRSAGPIVFRVTFSSPRVACVFSNCTLENLETFVNFCQAFGVPEISLFQPPDLYESRGIAMVLACIKSLGTEAQRHGFQGRCIGPKPLEQNLRYFSEDQLRAGHSILALQSGYNRGASQRGMSLGATRHVSDIRVSEMSKAGEAIVPLQSGFNRGATQKGMSIGGIRHVADMKTEEITTASHNIIGLQMGTNKLASQSGMTMGGFRHVSDIRADDMTREGNTIIGLQAGSNKGANQSGMQIGGTRHLVYNGAPMTTEGSSVIGLQMGFRGGASQSGMQMGGVRHAADIRADTMTQQGAAVISLQSGSNRGASQSGMTSFGAMRHAGEYDVNDYDPYSNYYSSAF